jgi:(p)ppGpp synthase/HD superfamily hydrolase
LPQTNPAWLNFAHTARARTSIIHYLKTLKISEAKKFGKKLLEQSLGTFDIYLKDIKKLDLRAALDYIGVSSLNKLLEEIGLGQRTVNIVAYQMAGRLGKPHYTSQKSIPLEINGSEGLVVNYGTCCKPIPGDSVIGHFTSERGMVVHQERCKNILSKREDPTQCFPVNWQPELSRGFSAEIKVIAQDEPALLATLASSIASTNTNIESINSLEPTSGDAGFLLTLGVVNRTHLSKVMRKLRTVKSVSSVTRVHSQEMRQVTTLH